MSARITAGLFMSHVPAIGAAVDKGLTEEPYWQPLFEGLKTSRQWIADNPVDIVILVYNDHGNAFSMEMIPTFALGMAASYQPTDEGWGPRPVPIVEGHPELSAHLAQSVIPAGFDLTLVNEMTVDHGLTVPLSMMYDQPAAWPTKVVPLAINVIQHPAPTGRRCLELGKAIRAAVDTFDDDLNVQIWGTGGMSHQLQGARAGLINPEWDHAFLERMINDPEGMADVPNIDYLREAGSEGVELVMWLTARGALADLNGGPAPTTAHRLYHVPASNTAVGHLILENA